MQRSALFMGLIAGFLIVGLRNSAQTGAAEPTVPFEVDLQTVRQGFDGQTCWVHARAGAVPPGESGTGTAEPLVVMTIQKLLLSGSDVFYPLHELRTGDHGKSWTEPAEQAAFARQTFLGGDRPLPTGGIIAPDLLQPGDETTVCDFTPKWHAASRTLLGTGHTVWYRDNRVAEPRPRGVAYAAYDLQSRTWNPWNVLELPARAEFRNAGAGSGQRFDLENGEILLPIYFKHPDRRQYSVTVCRCTFDGRTLRFVEHGNELTVPVDRGFAEPSLTRFQGRFYLTLRNDRDGYVSVSADGLNYSPARPWTFDDGQSLGNYNTQQHWVTHGDALFLVYTRKGAGNDHVFRHRAPLFIAEVDPQTVQVRRATERILVPERGARLGNFAVTEVSPEETWVTVTEWMQPQGVEQRGSDNSVFAARILWSRPNSDLLPRPSVELPESLARYSAPPNHLVGETGAYRSPLVFGDGTPVRTAADWELRREEIRREWMELLGAWPPFITDPEVEVLAEERRENFRQLQVRFRWTPLESTVGYLLIPDGPGPFPAVLTVYYEPETAIGQGGEHRDFAIQLARRGFVALSIGTTEASKAQTYAIYHPSLEAAKVEPLSMLGYAAANAWYVLAARPEVDPQRIGIVGHSFGGKWGMFASCLFDKFACAAWSDPGIVFDDTRGSINYWEPWYLGYHPQPWRKRGLVTPDNPARGTYPQLRDMGKDLHELHALMAPRPFLVSGGSEDPVERWLPLNHSVAVNRLLGHERRVFMTNRPEHSPNAESNAVIYEFFETFLGNSAAAPNGRE